MEKIKITGEKMLVVGRRFALMFLLLLFAFVYYGIRNAIRGKIPYLRRLPALEAIDEAVGRAAEMGRPVHVSPGTGSLTSQYGAETLAGISAVNYATRIAARKGTDIICTVVRTEVQPIAEEAVRTAFMMEGEAEKYDLGMIRFIPYGTAYDSAIMGIADRERPGANIIVGAYWHAALYLIENMNRIGAMSIGGTTRPVMTPFFIGGCDYALIAEEVLAVGAYLSDNPVTKGSFLGQDYAKYLAVIIIVIGAIAISLGSDAIIQLLKW